MTLVLDIEHLLGVAFAARDQASDAPDWPPQPDRVFSALVATWGARGEQGGERRALEWLEMQSAPEIVASDGQPRTAPIVFVPPNDAEAGRVGNEAVMPALRRRQARRFPAFRPDDPVVSLVWREAAPDGGTLAALNALAADTAYVGHSASLTRCRFHNGDVPGAAAAARRRIYRGHLAELERDFHAKPLRRPSPGAPVRAAPDQAKQAMSGVFSDRWLVLEHVEGEMPDIRAAALVAKELRNALMSGYREIGLGEAMPAAISGHSPDGRPSSAPHLAIVPLAFLGSPYASGGVFGFALIPPHGNDLFADPDFRRAMRAIMPLSDAGDDATERRRRLLLGRLGLAFEIGDGSGRRSLDPAPYIDEARAWASCTPIVLDRHLKATGNEAREDEIEGLIRQACVNVGLPPPEPKRISAGKHSAIEGAPSAYPSGGAPRWTRWKLPESLASRQLTHAVIEFPDKVRGPVILGAGRFVGLGLCRPLDPR
jgi:CRISPR-associated protein Csb2